MTWAPVMNLTRFEPQLLRGSHNGTGINLVNELRKFNETWTEFALAFQELCDSIRLFLREVRVRYWVCTQTSDHYWDYDDPRIAMVSDRNWRTHGKSLCPKCGGVLEERAAKVGKY